MANRLTSLNGKMAPWHLASELWTLRLLVNAEAWKALEYSTFEGRYCDFSLQVRGLNDFAQRVHDMAEAFQDEAELGRRGFPEDFGSQVEVMRTHKFAGIAHFDEIFKELQDGLAACEADARTKPLFYSPLNENLEMIARLFGLSEDEKIVFAYLLLVKSSGNMRSIANLFIYEAGGVKLMGEVVSCATGIELSKVRKILQQDSALMTSLIKIDGAPIATSKTFILLTTRLMRACCSKRA
ncbi:MAG: hypothetical protein Q4E62_03035 [Sutterellaceae bacterium]|nr:hypothetical protein [Sutterellaceae bacterium]